MLTNQNVILSISDEGRYVRVGKIFRCRSAVAQAKKKRTVTDFEFVCPSL